MNLKKGSAAFLLAMALLGGCAKPHAASNAAGTAQGRKSMPQILVGYQKTTRKKFTVSLRFYATIIPILQAGIFPKSSGWLTHVYVNTGDKVQQGELLAEMDHVQLDQAVYQGEAQAQAAFKLLQSLEAAYESAQANVAREQAIVQNDHTNMERDGNLLHQGFLSEQAYDDARTAYLSDKASLASLEAQLLSQASQVASQKAAVAAARANLQIAEANLSDSLLRAPFSGVVTMRNLDPGAFLSTAVTSSSTPVLTIADLRELKVMVAVADVDVPKVHIGEEALISTDSYPGRIFKGSVTRMAQSLDPESRTLAVEVDIPNPDDSLKPGMYAHVSLLAKVYHDAVVVPLNAVVFQGNKRSVWVLKETPRGTIGENVQVEIGDIEGSEALILHGLKGDEDVVTQGKESLKNNLIVKAMQVGAANSSPAEQGIPQ